MHADQPRSCLNWLTNLAADLATASKETVVERLRAGLPGARRLLKRLVEAEEKGAPTFDLEHLYKQPTAVLDGAIDPKKLGAQSITFWVGSTKQPNEVKAVLIVFLPRSLSEPDKEQSLENIVRPSESSGTESDST